MSQVANVTPVTKASSPQVRTRIEPDDAVAEPPGHGMGFPAVGAHPVDP